VSTGLNAQITYEPNLYFIVIIDTHINLQHLPSLGIIKNKQFKVQYTLILRVKQNITNSD